MGRLERSTGAQQAEEKCGLLFVVWVEEEGGGSSRLDGAQTTREAQGTHTEGLVLRLHGIAGAHGTTGQTWQRQRRRQGPFRH